MRALVVPAVLSLLIPAAPAAALHQPAVAGHAATTAAHAGAVAGAAQRRGVPRLAVRKKAGHLDHPWDVASLGKGRLLLTERSRARLSVHRNGKTRTVDFPSDRVWVSGETGLMGLEVDPGFRHNHRIYTCQGGFTGGEGHDVRVVAWKLRPGKRTVTRIRTLVGGFPTNSGRHGGCRLLITSNGSLLVGTGDAAIGTNPRNKRSLGGKTLRLDRKSGAPWPKNPFIKAGNHDKRYVFTYGHRNVQGLAERSDGSLWAIEQGTFRDDEVNRLVKGGDYGYNPVPGYNESVPMTDQSLPGHQVRARWRSGNPTLATSGGTFVHGKKWGALDGTLAVAALKASRVLFLKFDRSGHLKKVRSPKKLRGYGRIRTVANGPHHTLLLTTDNGNGHDKVLRVSPK